MIGGLAESYDSITSMRGMITDDCKNGNSGDNSFYKFLLALVIILDVLIPISSAYLIARTRLNRTFVG